jgi:cytochrome c oxidase cbb3-type subunit 3
MIAHRSVVAALAALASLASLASLAAGCDREDRRWDEPVAAARRPNGVARSTLHAGVTPARVEVHVRPSMPYAYEGNAWAINEGSILFAAFNCAGCHSAGGGGGMGPPLRDETWIYGKTPEELYTTIVEGRPNGMPAFRDKLAEHDVWKLVAYVRSLARLTPKDAVPARDDHLRAGPSLILGDEPPAQPTGWPP